MQLLPNPWHFWHDTPTRTGGPHLQQAHSAPQNLFQPNPFYKLLRPIHIMAMPFQQLAGGPKRVPNVTHLHSAPPSHLILEACVCWGYCPLAGCTARAAGPTADEQALLGDGVTQGDIVWGA